MNRPHFLALIALALSLAFPSLVLRSVTAEDLICGSALGLAPVDSPDHRKYAPSREVDYGHLAIDLTPDFKARSIAATTELRFKPIAQSLRELKLDAVDLRVSEVTATEPIQAWQNTDRQILITFTQPVPADREVKVVIR